MSNYDLVVIGSGPGGYVGAIRAAQLGLKTAIIEKDKTLGGTCLNVGCIPSKALLESSEKFSEAQHDLKKHGVVVSQVSLDLKAMLDRKFKIVDELTKGVAFLMKKNKIEVFQGHGELITPNEVAVRLADGKTQILNTKNIMLATGSVPIDFPTMPFDGTTVVSSTEALSVDKVPGHLVGVGGGVIGLELGSVWLRLGAKVTVLEYADRICSIMDGALTQELQKSLTKQGMKFILNTKVIRTESNGKKAKVFYEPKEGGEGQSLEADKILIAIGRKPFSEGLGLDKVGVKKNERGRVVVNDHLQTNVPNIYAIGDLIEGPMLAHKAEEEGVAVAENLAGKAGHVNYETVPSVVYTWPEVASVGLTEEQLKAKGIPYSVGKFPFTANGRAKALGFTEGFAKIISHKETDKVLGAHIIGPRASDLLPEAVLAMEFQGSSEDIARSFHSHPTLSEVVREAALDVEKRARQF